MIRTLVTATVLAASFAGAMLPVAASAHDHDGYGWQDDRGWQDGRGQGRDWHRSDYRRDDRYYDRRDDRRYYREYRGYYAQPAYGYQREAYSVQGGYDGGYYRANDGYRCHSDGTTGAIVGAIAGGLIGNGVAGRGDRTLGTVIGGAGGLFAGRAIDRSGNRC